MGRTSDTQWCIFNLNSCNYEFSLKKETLNKIKEWKSVNTTIYHDSYSFRTKEDIQERMKKQLVLWLLSEEERSEENTEVVVRPHKHKSEKIMIDISENLLDELMQSESDKYSYCYSNRWNKMIFYINESENKQALNERIKFQKNLHAKKKR